VTDAGDIRNWEAFARTHWEWAWAARALPRGITPTDIDGLIEIGDQYLIIETKEPGVPLPVGQRLALERLRRRVSGVLLIIWGQKDEPESVELQWDGGTRIYNTANRQKVLDIFEWFARCAESPPS
jgi:hypothetical protein